jgi:hypothetical protein
VYRLTWTDDTHTVAQAQLVVTGDDVYTSAGQEAYDNWRRPSWVDPGNSVHSQRLRVGGTEIADDLSMQSSGILTSDKFSVVNMSDNDTITSFRMTDTWYDSNGNVILRFNYTTIGYNLAAGDAAYVYDDDGFWNFLNLNLPASVMFAKRFSNAANFNVDDFGVLVGGPHNTGSSSRYVRDMTTGDLIDLGSENSNFALGVRVNVIPSPSSLALVGLVALVTRRRR